MQPLRGKMAISQPFLDWSWIFLVQTNTIGSSLVQFGSQYNPATSQGKNGPNSAIFYTNFESFGTNKQKRIAIKSKNRPGNFSSSRTHCLIQSHLISITICWQNKINDEILLSTPEWVNYRCSTDIYCSHSKTLFYPVCRAYFKTELLPFLPESLSDSIESQKWQKGILWFSLYQ